MYMEMSSDSTKDVFVSLIKFNGRPILPPVMTPSICNAMKAYRQIAIDLEYKRAERRRLLILKEIKDVTEKVKALNTLSEDVQPIQVNHPNSGILPESTTFQETTVMPSIRIRVPSGKTPESTYDIPSKSESDQNQVLPPKHDANLIWPSSTNFDTATEVSAWSVASTDLAKYMHFSPDLESVQQSRNDFSDIQSSGRESVSSVVTRLEVSDPHDRENMPTPKSHVRRSSYTLETPSPALLATVQKSTVSDKNGEFSPGYEHSGKKLHLESFLQNVSSVPIAWQDSSKSAEADALSGIVKRLYEDQEQNYETLRRELDALHQKGLKDVLESNIRATDKEHDTDAKVNYDKLSAAVKGYLVRRLMRTEKVQTIIKTIRDTLNCAINFRSENLVASGKLTPEDVTLHQRLLSQISGACYELHDVFFKISISDRMAIIGQDREILKGKTKEDQPVVRRLSSATIKAIERRRSKSSVSYVTKNSQSPGRRRLSRHNNRSRDLRGVIRPNSAPVPQTAVGRYLYQDNQSDKSVRPRHVRRSLYASLNTQANK